MTDSGAPSTQPSPQYVFIDRDVAWSLPMVDLLLHFADQDPPLPDRRLRVLWSGNSSADSFVTDQGTFEEHQESARQKVPEVPAEARGQLNPLTSDQLRDLFPDGELTRLGPPSVQQLEAFKPSNVPDRYEDLGHQYCVWQDMVAAAERLGAERGSEVE